MGDMAEELNALKKVLKQERQERRQKNLKRANPEGWTIHTEYHWSRTLNGERLDYWPSRNRFRYQGKTHTGDVAGFIKNREQA